jgi:hypothetical protein
MGARGEEAFEERKIRDSSLRSEFVSELDF